ncbi:MAG TPA: hotdog family protein [Candidatus Binatia bacterium]|jgi:predicted hotdog family 3-hydroxylacyl-ACP dehydratase
MEMPDIRSLVPHSGAMVLLDRVISADEDNLCAEVTIRPGSLFYSDGGVGAWVGLEYMAQAIGAYAGYRARLRGEPIKIGFLLGTRRYESRRPFFPNGAVLQIRIKRALESENGLASFDCHIAGDNGEIASASVTVFQPANDKAVFDESWP